MVSLKNGWLDNAGPMRLRHRRPSAKENFWFFLDASRSTGMNRFLNVARDVLAGVSSHKKAGRSHLIVLVAGEIRWVARNASPKAFLNALEQLREASGKSLIVEAIARLHRGRLRNGSSPKDRVVILSDGLASPAPGEKPSETLIRLRHMLRRLTRPGAPCAWLHPAAERGLKRWIPELLRGLPVARFEISGHPAKGASL